MLLAGGAAWAQPLDMESRISQANARLAAGSQEEAIRLFGEGLAQDCTALPLYTALAAIYAREGRYSLAIEQLEIALRFDPGYVLGYVNLGGIYTKLAQYHRAEPHLKKALELAPQVPGAWHQLALCHLALEQPAAADSVLGQALGAVRTEGKARQSLEELREQVGKRMGEVK